MVERARRERRPAHDHPALTHEVEASGTLLRDGLQPPCNGGAPGDLTGELRRRCQGLSWSRSVAAGVLRFRNAA
jgi:hypothetical protein